MAEEEAGVLRRRIGGREVEISRTAVRRRYDVVIDGRPAGTGTLRRRRLDDLSDDDVLDGVVYEIAVRGHAPIPLSLDEHGALTRPRRSRPSCAGCGGPLNAHGLEGVDLGDAGRYCFDCT